MIEALFTVTFLPLENRNHYNHYLTDEVTPPTHNCRQMKLLWCLKETLWNINANTWRPENVSCDRTATGWHCTASSYSDSQLFYFPLKHNMELLYWTRQRRSTCRESTSNTAFGRNGKHCRQSAGDLGGCVRFWLHEINSFISTAHISFAVRTASSWTKWLSALCYRKYSRGMYPEEWHGKRVCSF